MSVNWSVILEFYVESFPECVDSLGGVCARSFKKNCVCVGRGGLN